MYLWTRTSRNSGAHHPIFFTVNLKVGCNCSCWKGNRLPPAHHKTNQTYPWHTNNTRRIGEHFRKADLYKILRKYWLELNPMYICTLLKLDSTPSVEFNISFKLYWAKTLSTELNTIWHISANDNSSERDTSVNKLKITKDAINSEALIPE